MRPLIHCATHWRAFSEIGFFSFSGHSVSRATFSATFRSPLVVSPPMAGLRCCALLRACASACGTMISPLITTAPTHVSLSARSPSSVALSGGSLRHGGKSTLGGPPGWRWAKGNVAAWVVSTSASLFQCLRWQGRSLAGPASPHEQGFRMAWCGFFRAAKGGEQLRRGIWDTSNRHGNFILCLFEYFICGRCSLLRRTDSRSGGFHFQCSPVDPAWLSGAADFLNLMGGEQRSCRCH